MNDQPRKRLRLRYRKDDVLMYISHRDLLRFLLKMLRRVEIPFATSGKFSPKAKVTSTTRQNSSRPADRPASTR